MKLYVIRHAQAVSTFTNERALTPKGQQQSMNIGNYFKASGVVPDIVLASPMLRARQTAEILCVSAGFVLPQVESWLSCGMSPEAAMHELKAYAALDSVVIVGHQPDLGFFLDKVLGGFPHAVKKASVSVLANYGGDTELEDYRSF